MPLVPVEFVEKREVRKVKLELPASTRKELVRLAQRESSRLGKPRSVSEGDVARAGLRCFLANADISKIPKAGWFDWLAARNKPAIREAVVVGVQLREVEVARLEEICARYETATGERLSITRLVRGIVAAFLTAVARSEKSGKPIEQEWFRQAA